MRRAIVVGLGWGVFCGVANGLPIATTLAQMAVPWIWVAAFVGFREADNSRSALLLGAVTLLVSNFAYFAVGSVARGMSDLPIAGGIRFFSLWALVGLVIGPISGLAGWWLRADRGSLAAVVAIATVSIAEPLALWAHIDHLDAHVAYVGVAVAGLAFPLIWFGRDRRIALKALTLTLVLTYPLAVVLEASLIALGQISPPMRLVAWQESPDDII